MDAKKKRRLERLLLRNIQYVLLTKDKPIPDPVIPPVPGNALLAEDGTDFLTEAGETLFND